MRRAAHTRSTQNPQNTLSDPFSASSASSALIAASFVVLLMSPVTASAQSGPGTPTSQGPMIVERMHSGFVAAPDVKITQVDNRTSALAGGYAGWLTDDTLFIGGGAYVLANQASDRKMAYGGLVIQWLAHADRRIGFAAKGLIGGGQATLGTTLTQSLRLPDLRDIPGLPQLRGDFRGDLRGDLERLLRAPTSTRIRQREAFFIAEPQVDLVVRFSQQVRLTTGVGYRMIGADGRNERRLRGATGNIAVQFGGGS